MDDPQATLKLLLIEDSTADAELIMRALRGFPQPIEHMAIASEAALRQALTDFSPGVILSDFSMPGFSGKEALRIVCEVAPNIPFLFVSGTIGEEQAIDALQRGASDYVLKDNLLRLPSAIERALDEARHRADRARIEHELRDSEERFRTIVESSQDWIWEDGVNGKLTYSNGAIAGILGYGVDELIGASAYDLMLPEDREQATRRVSECAAAQCGWKGWQLRWRHRDGSVRVLESTATVRRDAEGGFAGFRGVDHDVTERLQQEARIQHLARIHAVLSALGNVVLRADDHDRLLAQVCEVAVLQGGFAAARTVVPDDGHGLRTAASFGDSSTISLIEEWSARTGEDAESSALGAGLQALNGRRNVMVHDFSLARNVPASVRREMAAAGISAQIALPIGQPPWAALELYSSTPQEFNLEEIELLTRLVGEVDYAVDFLAKSERLEYLAYHHPVTGLFNRAAFQLQVSNCLRQGHTTVAMLSLANFRRINDSRGRDFGDQLMKVVAQRLRNLATPNMILAHVGDDAFLVAQPTEDDFEKEVERLEGLLRAMDEAPCDIAGEQIFISVHGGVAVSPAHGNDGRTLERNAAAALAEGLKREVRLEPYTERLRELSSRRVALEADTRGALARNELELFYQPTFAADGKGLEGAEALLRWRHPLHGMISPQEFIPILEDSGQIVQVGRWVMQKAIETALAWRARGFPTFRIAVNVSARELRDANFLAESRALLEPHAGNQLLDVEVTESLLVDDVEQCIRLLESLRSLGCRVAIDDFGTGYSSLNYLIRLPADVIKVDQSFVAQLEHSQETVSLVTTIIELAHSLRMRVVAEGVETEVQADLLRQLHCDWLQGFLLGKPMPSPEFVTHLL
jgi:PAS domain S-box-containing protein/diguanylate cyclase (GGDEF)-like protein